MPAKRHFPSWLEAYVNFAAHTEAPRLMHFWAGVWALAGVLRKRVWMDQVAFRWIPNFFIVFVAPPGVVSKSTTAGFAESFLRNVPGIKFGPDIVTWQSLITSFAASCETFEYNGEHYPMSPINLCASEFGNLIDFKNHEMVDMFIDLWDGRKALIKNTKNSGNDIVDSPWVNMLACTTPNWIATNMHAGIVGGGFTARCIFIYADTKERLIAYPKYNFPEQRDNTKIQLQQDLEHIAITLCGEYELTAAARTWGERWYEQHWKSMSNGWREEWLLVYMARKQTHLHKLAMVLAASQRDELIITDADLKLADVLLESTEKGYNKVFAHVGKKVDACEADKLLDYIRSMGEATYPKAYKILHNAFPQARDLEGAITGLIRAGWVNLEQRGSEMYLVYIGENNGAEKTDD